MPLFRHLLEAEASAPGVGAFPLPIHAGIDGLALGLHGAFTFPGGLHLVDAFLAHDLDTASGSTPHDLVAGRALPFDLSLTCPDPNLPLLGSFGQEGFEIGEDIHCSNQVFGFQ